MTQRNIALALFAPCEVFNSSWPRFIGFKRTSSPIQSSGLFGLVDANTRMHTFFFNTTIEEVLATKLIYATNNPNTTSRAYSCTTLSEKKVKVNLPDPRKPDHTVRWLDPYVWTDKDNIEWYVYPVITGADINIKGTTRLETKADGYWDYGIWQPKINPDEEWTDIQRLEQSTINYVISCGYTGKTSLTMFKDDPRYGTYVDTNNYVEIPPRKV